MIMNNEINVASLTIHLNPTCRIYNDLLEFAPTLTALTEEAEDSTSFASGNTRPLADFRSG